MINKNGGYVGYSMSVRAANAYDDGEMPLSKWNKSRIIDVMAKANYDKDLINMIGKLPLKTIRSSCLEFAGKHHTSKCCNLTSFYALKSEEELKGINFDSLLEGTKVKVEEPTYITALIRREYRETVYGKYNKKRYDRQIEYIIAQFRSNEKRVNGYNLTSNNIQIVFFKEQKDSFFDLEEFKHLDEVKFKIN